MYTNPHSVVYQENRRPPICGNSPLNPAIFILLTVAKMFVVTMLPLATYIVSNSDISSIFKQQSYYITSPF